MKTKTILHKSLKNGGHFEIGVGVRKPFFRNKLKGRRRVFTLDVFPVVCYASVDHEWVHTKDNDCQTTLYIGWLIFYVYFETFRPVRGTAKP